MYRCDRCRLRATHTMVTSRSVGVEYMCDEHTVQLIRILKKSPFPGLLRRIKEITRVNP